MEHIFKDLAILLLVSLPINILFHRLKLSSVMGFLVAGVLIGPHGLQLIGELESVKQLAEIGVILLLFVIGLEFSLNHLLKNLPVLAGVGALQVGLTAGGVYVVAKFMGLEHSQGILLGCLIALSSTAIVLKMITDRAELDTVHGKICIGTLLFQDLAVVPMMLLIPLLARAGQLAPLDFAMALLKSIAAVGLIFYLARLLVPRTLERIARLGSKEHLTLFVILIILGTCWVSHKMGLSLAMGAFIAGMIISESEYNHQIILDILPLKDYFSSIFFISIGMLLDVQVFIEGWKVFLALTVGVVLIKAFFAFLAARILKNSIRISFLVGLRLAQVGEFSLMLASLALDHHLFTSAQYQGFLIVSILTMLIAPVLIQGSSEWSIKLHSLFKAPPLPEIEPTDKGRLSGHVVVAGYGLVGRNLCRVLKEINIPFLVLELGGERVKRALKEDMNALFGDSTHRETLIRAGIKEARMMVFAISDYFAAERGIRVVRELNPDIYIVVRTHFASQVEQLRESGADEVIPEEFETSVEIFSRVLRQYRIPNNVIEQQVELIRLEGYGMFRGLSLDTESLRTFSTYLAASLTESYHLMEEDWAHGKRIKDLDLTAQTGARLIAVVRGKEVHANPAMNFRLAPQDILILFGRHVQLDQSVKFLQTGFKTGGSPPSGANLPEE